MNTVMLGTSDARPVVMLAEADETMVQRYSALTTLHRDMALHVAQVALRAPQAEDGALPDELDLFSAARTASMGVLAQAGVIPPTTLLTLDLQLERSFAALSLLQPHFRSALTLAYLLELDLDEIAAVEQTDPRIAFALVRGAELALYHGLTDQLGAMVLGADGTIDISWLVSRLPGAAYQPDLPFERAAGMGVLLQRLADAILRSATAAAPMVPAAARSFPRWNPRLPAGVLSKTGAAIGTVAVVGSGLALVLAGGSGGGENDANEQATLITQFVPTTTATKAKAVSTTITTRTRPTTTARPLAAATSAQANTSSSAPAIAALSSDAPSTTVTGSALGDALLAAAEAAVSSASTSPTTAAPRATATTGGSSGPTTPVIAGTTTTAATSTTGGTSPSLVTTSTTAASSSTTRPSTSTTEASTTSTTRATTSTTDAPTTTATPTTTSTTRATTTTTAPTTTTTAPTTTTTEATTTTTAPTTTTTEATTTTTAAEGDPPPDAQTPPA